ncbi:branched-chain-amino-acid transaminase [soil metagenome]
MSYINYNGKISVEGTALVNADNRGLRYGDGLFETIRLSKGKMIFEAAHFDRLWNGMKVLEFELPKHFTKEMLQEEVLLLCKRNGHERDPRIRINIIRADGGLYDAQNHRPNYIIQTWSLKADVGLWNSNGLVAGIYAQAKKSCDILSNIKHNNYLPYVLAALHAKKEKWNDAILLNSNDRICDTTIANVFIIKNGTVFTPPLNEGCVAGIMRAMLIKELKKQNMPIEETALTIDDIAAADEVFFTNSMYNIRWVQQIGDKTYNNITTQKIYSLFIPTIY